MSEHQSKVRQQAEAVFAKMRDGYGSGLAAKPTTSAADEKTARLKAARLARDAERAKKR